MRTVSEVARNPSGDLAAHLHELEHFGPTRNHGVDREFKRLATVDRAIELGTVKERTRVVDLDNVGIARNGTGTFGNNLVLKTTGGSHNAFGSLVAGEEGFAGGLVGFGSEAILLHLFGLTVLGEFREGLENDGIVHQESSGIVVVAFLEGLDEEVDVQINGVTGHQLEMGLITKMGTEGIAVLVLFGHQGLFGLGTLAQLITTSHKQGNSACSNNQFSLHKNPLFLN